MNKRQQDFSGRVLCGFESYKSYILHTQEIPSQRAPPENRRASDPSWRNLGCRPYTSLLPVPTNGGMNKGSQRQTCLTILPMLVARTATAGIYGANASYVVSETDDPDSTHHATFPVDPASGVSLSIGGGDGRFALATSATAI